MAMLEKIKANQESQYKFLDKMTKKEIVQYNKLFYYSITCRDCGESVELHTADGSKQWIGKHEGHNTWLEYMGKR